MTKIDLPKIKADIYDALGYPQIDSKPARTINKLYLALFNPEFYIKVKDLQESHKQELYKLADIATRTCIYNEEPL